MNTISNEQSEQRIKQKIDDQTTGHANEWCMMMTAGQLLSPIPPVCPRSHLSIIDLIRTRTCPSAPILVCFCSFALGAVHLYLCWGVSCWWVQLGYAARRRMQATLTRSHLLDLACFGLCLFVLVWPRVPLVYACSPWFVFVQPCVLSIRARSTLVQACLPLSHACSLYVCPCFDAQVGPPTNAC